MHGGWIHSVLVMASFRTLQTKIALQRAGRDPSLSISDVLNGGFVASFWAECQFLHRSHIFVRFRDILCELRLPLPCLRSVLHISAANSLMY